MTELSQKGDLYVGEWLVDDKLMNIRQGRGIRVTENRNVYEGYFKGNKAHGKGRKIWHKDDGTETYYIGDFENN